MDGAESIGIMNACFSVPAIFKYRPCKRLVRPKAICHWGLPSGEKGNNDA
jgi:hypothetical protein